MLCKLQGVFDSKVADQTIALLAQDVHLPG